MYARELEPQLRSLKMNNEVIWSDMKPWSVCQKIHIVHIFPFPDRRYVWSVCRDGSLPKQVSARQHAGDHHFVCFYFSFYSKANADIQANMQVIIWLGSPNLLKFPNLLKNSFIFVFGDFYPEVK